MPMLDVNDAFSPEFWDTIQVVRRTVTMDSHGRAVTTETPQTVRAVVTAASPNELQRLPEEEYFNKAVEVFSPFRFQGTTEDEVGNIVTHPDHILWHGSVYVVRMLDDYAGYGRGFIHVVCTSIKAVDPAPPASGGDNVEVPVPQSVTVH